MYWFLLLLLIIASTTIHTHRWHSMVYVHSFILIIIMVVLSMGIFIALLFMCIELIFALHVFRVSSIFSLILLLAVLIGILMSNFLHWFQKRYHYGKTSLTVMEYYIQWSLIYTTIYQVMFSDLSKSSKYMVKLVVESRVINPDYIVMALFPALISTWIAIVIYKVQKNQI